MTVEASKTTSWKHYLELTKPGVQALLFVSCMTGMLLAADFYPPLEVLIFGLLGISLLAASSAVINHIFDVELDALMKRTSSRPIVKGYITKTKAINFSIGLFVLGSSFLLYFTNLLTWVLTALTFVFYGFIYTKYLKFMTSQNIVIGGLAGAMPPLLGWTAITNTIEPNALLLVLIILVWTPPHFWALAVHKVEDYKEAKVPMLPVQKGIAFTKQHILLYTILLIVATVLPFSVGMFGYFYLSVATLSGLIFLYYSMALYRDKENKKAMPVFLYSIWYLALLFSAMLIDSFLSL
ncbi:MAG: heme o synthase [Gammaproteobacteria bacterium]|nr:MAG: protoheme IX farnesyltransferase [Gammaproteobacteria bacterium]|tara:strand:- start:847 stop:1731 length:885 start_codon:yes stop_codon:yes gene_type:complete